jgi:phosphate transport system substrate-binding protein
MVIGGVVPVLNVPGIQSGQVQLTGELLGDIFLGKITNWNDGRLAKDNPGVKLPGLDINVVHRSDGSGTTFIFTDYLSKVSKDWANGPGKGTAVNWPKGIGGKGNEAIAGLVRQLPGAIGYVELIYALQNHIAYGEVRNAAGHWVKASIEGVTAAAASVKQMPADYRVSITNAPGADAYPISSFTWLLVPLKAQDPAKGKVIKDFLNWMVTTGQSETKALNYAPLPEGVASRVKATIAGLQ